MESTTEVYESTARVWQTTTEFWQNTSDTWDNVTDWYSNDTVTPYSLKDERLYKAYNAMVIVNSAFITLAMGAGVIFKDMLPNLKRPIGPAIGVFCQSILMPAMCFAYAIALDLDDGIAVGMLVVGSCPGGALSNIFTYWSRGDLTLSVVMTVVSTTLAIGFLPLNMFIYARYWTDDDTVSDLPYKSMVFTMLYTWVAAAIGMLIAWKAPKAAKYVAKIGSYTGFLLMAVSGVLQSQVYPGLFNVDIYTWIGAMTMPLISAFCGFSIASCFRKWLPLSHRRAIMYETGVQNVAVALAVIALSVERSSELAAQLNVVPMIYAGATIIYGLFSTFVHQMYFRHNEGNSPFKQCPKYGTQGSITSEHPSEHSTDVDAGVINEAYDINSVIMMSPISMEPGGHVSSTVTITTDLELSDICIGGATGDYGASDTLRIRGKKEKSQMDIETYQVTDNTSA